MVVSLGASIWDRYQHLLERKGPLRPEPPDVPSNTSSPFWVNGPHLAVIAPLVRSEHGSKDQRNRAEDRGKAHAKLVLTVNLGARPEPCGHSETRQSLRLPSLLSIHSFRRIGHRDRQQLPGWTLLEDRRIGGSGQFLASPFSVRFPWLPSGYRSGNTAADDQF